LTPFSAHVQPHSSRGRRVGVAIVLAVALVAGLAALPPALDSWRARASLPSGPAQWIWAARDPRNPYPLAFYAVRDFTLSNPLRGARLLAAAEPEVVLTLNGVRVGTGGRIAGGTRLDAYEVGPLLAPGANRLVAELRSADGEGGFLARLVAEPSGETVLATDSSWRVFDRFQPGLVRGWLPFGHEGSAPRVWGYPPFGRWGRPRPGAERPLFDALTGTGPAAPGMPGGRARLAVTRDGGRPGFVLLDWGEEVSGYLALELGNEPGLAPDQVQPAVDHLRVALLAVGPTPPPPTLEGATPGIAVLVPSGAREWLAIRPRRFRYALVMGLERPLTGRVYPVTGFRGEALLAESAVLDSPPEGVFGIVPPPAHTPTEDAVRRELDRLNASRQARAARD
jgi:hypothetical protein